MSKMCPLPWIHLSNYPDGRVQPCCEFTGYITKDDGTPFYMQKDKVEDIFSSNYLKNLRNEFRKGTKPVQCINCWNKEEIGITSKREIYNTRVNVLELPLDYEKDPEYPVEYQLTLNNSCNLRCRMCNPEYSSSWAKDYKTLSPAEKKLSGKNPGEFIHKQLYNPQSIFMKDIDKWAPHLHSIEALGGDPLYSVAWYKLIDYLIDKGFSKNIHLAMSSNGTFFNAQFVDKVLNNFKSFGIALSIDGVGGVFEYLRSDAKWDSVSKNILNYQSYLEDRLNYNVHYTYSVTWHNVLLIQDFINFVRYPFEKRMNIHFLPITYPFGMAVYAVSDSFKANIKEYLLGLSLKYPQFKSQLEGIINLSYSTNLTDEQRVKAREADKIMDRLRGIDSEILLNSIDPILGEEYKKRFSI